MSLTVTILGCGASSGVPLIGCDCAVCRSNDPKNRRLRPSILIEEEGFRLLIDATPDLREQCLANNISSVDAILFTHAHADHCHGIDDIRLLNFHHGGAIPAYADADTMREIRGRFEYAFQPPQSQYGWFRPSLTPHLLDTETWPALNILPKSEIRLFPQRHGKLMTIGLRIGDFAYSTDVNFLPEKSFAQLDGLDTWIVDCLRDTPSPTHAELKTVLEWADRLKPKRSILTHMSHDFDYAELRSRLRQGVEPAYDSMKLTFDR